MIWVRLETESGAFVAEKRVPRFVQAPEVIVWGNRTFLLWSNEEPRAIFRECFAVVATEHTLDEDPA